MKRALITSICLCLLACAGASAQQGQGKVALLNELRLRYYASNVVMPKFPTEAVRDGARGVAVAKIRFDAGGRVLQVSVLEAPHPSIRVALEEAARQWVFTPPIMDGQVMGGQGKLTFYYVIEKGNGVVNNPVKVEQYLKRIGRGQRQTAAREAAKWPESRAR